MLHDSQVFVTIPVSDLARSKEFYQNTLGLTLMGENMGGAAFTTGKGNIFLYPRQPTHAAHTLASFDVSDLETIVSELTAKGVVFEKYDETDIKTDDRGIMTMANMKAAWFKDPDGNILGITQGGQ